MAINDRTLATRFWAKVDRRGPDQCWPWTAYRNKKGYGQIKVGGKYGQVISAHRVAHELLIGPIPDGLCVCHSCDNPPCCNPAHFWLGTNAENNADKVAKDRHSKLAPPVKPERRARGERSGNAKLTEAAVLAIRADDRVHRVIALDYGVDPSLIGLVKKRAIWVHV